MQPRRTLEIEGVRHSAPIPMAAAVGGLLATSGVSGIDPATGTAPDNPSTQVSLVFRHLRDLLSQVGAEPSAVVKLTFFVSDNSIRESINDEWVKMFPDPDDRPARHTLVYESLRPGHLVQAEMIAVVPT